MKTVVVMGVSGAGKTTVGSALARALGVEFIEGDRYHPLANVAKMSRGEALDDDDRLPWLDRLVAELDLRHRKGQGAVLTCSALKRAYRNRLRRAQADLRFVYLRGDQETIRARLSARSGHFMPPSLLESQFAVLEEPGAEESAITLDVSADPDVLVAGLVARLAAPARI